MIDTSHLHPMLIHFPIALIDIGFIAEIIAIFIRNKVIMSRLGFYLLITGTLSTIAALFVGKLFTPDMEGSTGRIVGIHEIFAWTTLAILITLSILRITMINKTKINSKLKWFAFILYGIAAIAVSITGYFGGTLVYNYMIPL